VNRILHLECMASIASPWEGSRGLSRYIPNHSLESLQWVRNCQRVVNLALLRNEK
jgi:hypothetical protein